MSIYEANKYSIINILNSLFINESSTYIKIYLSSGSKYNEKEVIYGLSDIPNHSTNSQFQIFPAFLRDYSENDRILSICIDDFSNLENKEINRKIIGSVIKNSVDFVFVDWNLELLDFYIFLPEVIRILVEKKIGSHQFYCVFYFKFICSNTIEESFSDKVVEVSRNIFKETIYRNSLYIWFGYNPNLYNFIYPAYYSLSHFIYNLSIIQRRFHYDQIDTGAINEWIYTLEPYTQARIIPFLTNCFDITQYSNDGNLWPIYHPSNYNIKPIY
jgi:hypothetical protein